MGYIDRGLLSLAHMYRGGGAVKVYEAALPLDPEGVFACLPSIVHVGLGVQCGVTLLVHRKNAAGGDASTVVWRLLFWSALGVFLGAALAGWRIESSDGPVPVNKALWSLSFVLLTVGIAYGLLAACLALTDVWRWWSGAPFSWAGMNAIVLYVGHSVLVNGLPFHWRYGEMNTHLVLLLANGWTAGMWLVVAWWMHRRQWFVSV